MRPNPQFLFIEEILNGKLPFFVQWREKFFLNQKGKDSLETVYKN